MLKIHESKQGVMHYDVPKDILKLKRQIFALEAAVDNDKKTCDSESLQFHEPALMAARAAFAQLEAEKISNK